jgi:hypothetical protein
MWWATVSPWASSRFTSWLIGGDTITRAGHAVLSRKGQEIAYLGQDGIHVFDRESRSDILIATRDIGEPQKIHWGADDDSLVVGIRGAPRSEQSMFWGAILALKPEAGSMPELLIEGDDIYLLDVIPDDEL